MMGANVVWSKWNHPPGRLKTTLTRIEDFSYIFRQVSKIDIISENLSKIPLAEQFRNVTNLPKFVICRQIRHKFVKHSLQTEHLSLMRLFPWKICKPNKSGGQFWGNLLNFGNLAKNVWKVLKSCQSGFKSSGGMVPRAPHNIRAHHF